MLIPLKYSKGSSIEKSRANGRMVHRSNLLMLLICNLWCCVIALSFAHHVFASQVRFDGKGVICPAQNAVASQSEAEHGWLPRASAFWFSGGRVNQIEIENVEKGLVFNTPSKSANYYSNDNELWFDLGYTYSLRLQTLQLFRVISMGGETELRNKECQILDGDSFWKSVIVSQ